MTVKFKEIEKNSTESKKLYIEWVKGMCKANGTSYGRIKRITKKAPPQLTYAIMDGDTKVGACFVAEREKYSNSLTGVVINPKHRSKGYLKETLVLCQEELGCDFVMPETKLTQDHFNTIAAAGFTCKFGLTNMETGEPTIYLGNDAMVERLDEMDGKVRVMPMPACLA